jgi:hypothetical protein
MGVCSELLQTVQEFKRPRGCSKDVRAFPRRQQQQPLHPFFFSSLPMRCPLQRSYESANNVNSILFCSDGGDSNAITLCYRPVRDSRLLSVAALRVFAAALGPLGFTCELWRRAPAPSSCSEHDKYHEYYARPPCREGRVVYGAPSALLKLEATFSGGAGADQQSCCSAASSKVRAALELLLRAAPKAAAAFEASRGGGGSAQAVAGRPELKWAIDYFFFTSCAASGDGFSFKELLLM